MEDQPRRSGSVSPLFDEIEESLFERQEARKSLMIYRAAVDDYRKEVKQLGKLTMKYIEESRELLKRCKVDINLTRYMDKLDRDDRSSK